MPFLPGMTVTPSGDSPAMMTAEVQQAGGVPPDSEGPLLVQVNPGGAEPSAPDQEIIPCVRRGEGSPDGQSSGRLAALLSAAVGVAMRAAQPGQEPFPERR